MSHAGEEEPPEDATLQPKPEECLFQQREMHRCCLTPNGTKRRPLRGKPQPPSGDNSAVQGAFTNAAQEAVGAVTQGTEV